MDEDFVDRVCPCNEFIAGEGDYEAAKVDKPP